MSTDTTNPSAPEATAKIPPYAPERIEPKWQAKWQDESIYQPILETANSGQSEAPPAGGSKGPFYNLMMFPYPSAEGLHVGNMYAFTGADVYGRFKRQQGYSVFEPFGLDGFGIHSENYALKVGSHPMEQADISEKNFYRQVHSIGNSYDWRHTVETYKPEYYQWTQWLFIELFKAGLAYRQKSPVNFCPSCKTVLADEQVEDGKCERCGSVVEKRELEQWFFRITKYSDRLLEGLDHIDWTEKVKLAQRNWIGKSDGAKLSFSVVGTEKKLEVFTTRPDTLYGATFMVVSPEHPLVESWLGNTDVASYVEKARAKSPEERRENKEKSGVFSGAYALNPVNNKQMPIWIADYVLMGYGTGAIMAVPAHDERDYEFASEYGLPVIQTIAPYEVHSGDQEPRGDVETLNRKTVDAIITDGEGNYLLQREGDQVHFVGGGVDDEDVTDEEAIRREVLEETGYTDIASIKQAAPFSAGIAYRMTKNRNQKTWGAYYEVTLDGKNQVVSEIEDGKHTVEWVKKEDVARKLTWKWHSEAWEIYCSTKAANFYKGEGIIINSEDWNGWQMPQESDKVLSDLEDRQIGSRYTQYHLRDWLISRQRYWGAPIPMIYCENCAHDNKGWLQENGLEATDWNASGWYPAEELPVVLPKIEDYKPLGTGKAPLASHPEFYEVKCPSCGGEAKRETDVSDTFLDSSWYFLRYLATDWAEVPFPSEKFVSEKPEATTRTDWLPVTMYIGGAEHSVLHLLYTRFVYQVLADRGFIDSKKGDEPFPRFYAHGLIIKDGAKMSKSKGNVVVPDEYIAKYGADTLRTYLMFLGPFSQGGDFSDSGIEGINRFMKRVWKFTVSSVDHLRPTAEKADDSFMHETIRGVTEDIEALRYNTAIAKIMMYYNHLNKEQRATKEQVEVLLQLLAPFAPHMTEELWEQLGNGFSIHTALWPEFDKSAVQAGQIVIAVQVNGKLRDTITGSSSELQTQQDVEHVARERENVKKHVEGKTVRKVIYVPGKILNFVV